MYLDILQPTWDLVLNQHKYNRIYIRNDYWNLQDASLC